MGQPDRAGDMIIHRIIHCRAQSTIQISGIALHVHHRPRGRKCWHIARRVPCAACCQFVALQKNAICHPGLGQMIQARGANDAPTNDHNAGCCWKICHGPKLPLPRTCGQSAHQIHVAKRALAIFWDGEKLSILSVISNHWSQQFRPTGRRTKGRAA